ncbi:hypothetical protein V3C99_014568 [Haemonchus contortus]|nr:Major sperm protein domain containing protein [Haemonchus contortus]
MGVELSIKPPNCDISVAGGTKRYTLVNHCALVLAYRIIINPGSNYSVPENQLYGLIKVGYTAEMEITRKKAPPKADKLMVQYASVKADETDPKKAFASGKPVGELTGETMMKLIASE